MNPSARSGTQCTIVIATLMLCALVARAQEGEEERPVYSESWRIGLFGAGQLLRQSADMRGLPGVPSCCPRYEHGTGQGLALGLSGEMLLFSGFSGGLRALFTTCDGMLTADEEVLVTAGYDTARALFGHTIETSKPAVTVELFLSCRVFSDLMLLAGGRADVMLGGSYHQYEEIISPEEILFENDSRRRQVHEGEIPMETGMHLALTAGLRYDIPLDPDHSFLLSPEIQVWQGLTNLVAGETWTMSGARLGLSLSYTGRAAPIATSPLNPGIPGTLQTAPSSDTER